MNLKRLKHDLTYIFNDVPPPFDGSVLELIDDILKHNFSEATKTSLQSLRDKCEMLVFEKQQLENALLDMKSTLGSLDRVIKP